MAAITTTNITPSPLVPVRNESHSSGVSWGAVIGGAFVAAVFYLILLALGAGLGLSAISPWSGAGISAKAFGAGAIAWLIVIEIVASGLGGYLTGRLRTKWATIHTDEVFFRDTANGFLAWAVAVIVTVTCLISTGVSMAGNIAHNELNAQPGDIADPNAYYVDSLFRAEHPAATPTDQARAEVERIFANALSSGELPPADRDYLAGLVSGATGISPADAGNRISNAMTRAKEAEDQARKTTARFLLWFFVALMLGALSASYAATVGGRQRDHVKEI